MHRGTIISNFSTNKFGCLYPLLFWLAALALSQAESFFIWLLSTFGGIYPVF